MILKRRAAVFVSGAVDDPRQALRRSWHATALDYFQHGAAALARDGETALAELLRASPYFWVISPSLAQTIGRPPPPSADHFFFWTRERYGYGLKTTAALYHALLGEPAPGATLIATAQLRATHYFEGSLAFTLLVEADPAGAHGCFLIYINRARVDALRGGLGARLRPLIARGAPRATRAELRALRTRLDEWRAHQTSGPSALSWKP